QKPLEVARRSTFLEECLAYQPALWLRCAGCPARRSVWTAADGHSGSGHRTSFDRRLRRVSLDEQSSAPGRYRGRRRVPVAPRSHYAAVVTTAIVGAGVVALGAGAAFDDAKANPALTASGLDQELLERAEAAERVDRAERQSEGLNSSIAEAPETWLLPTPEFDVSSPYGERWGRLHGGVDLAVPLGTPVYAMNSGTVVLARWHGGYGYAVIIDHGNGEQTLYGHNSSLLVSEGQQVDA